MKSHRALLWIARAGFAGRGCVFLILGGFALLAALGQGSQPVGTTDALRSLLGSPIGWVVILALAAGLLCFAIFRAIEAVLDVHGYGDAVGGILHRVALGAAGLSYVGLAAIAGAIVLGWNVGQNSDQSVRDWTAWLLSIPGGDWIVGIAGVITVAIGIGLAVSGFRESFKRRVRVDAEPRPYVTALGVIGFIARSVVFVLIGAFLAFAAITADPQQAQGFGGALRTIEGEPYGRLLLGVMALGLSAFGLFGISEALFADIKLAK